MANLCIIPARGGSKRIPRKNIKDFLGKPIIAYSIETALKSKLFDEVMVSTDDKEIATLAKSYGAEVPFMRSEINSNDIATTFEVLEEVILKYEELNNTFANICCLYPCSPLTKQQILKEAYDKLTYEKLTTVFPVVAYSNPIQRAFKLENNRLCMFDYKYSQTRSQDLERAYYDSGQFYWLNTKLLMEERNIYSNNSSGIVIDEIYAQDIDNEIDWKLAEIKYKLIN
jgi:pseudaminic acid cytidylyltransferase